jgi:hypothetical protein
MAIGGKHVFNYRKPQYFMELIEAKNPDMI